MYVEAVKFVGTGPKNVTTEVLVRETAAQAPVILSMAGLAKTPMGMHTLQSAIDKYVGTGS